MAFYVIALGGTLFTMLGAGVTILESQSGSPSSDPNVTTITQSESPDPIPSVVATPSESLALRVAPSPAKDKITSMEDEVSRLINIERGKECDNPLRTDERLRTAARNHSADMAKNDYFSHVSLDGRTFVDRIARAGYPRGSAAAENIAAGYGSAKAVVQGWMDSPGHRRNIMSCGSKAVGVGLAYRGGKPYWTQDFGRS